MDVSGHARAVPDGLRAFYEAPPIAGPGAGAAAALALFREVAERVPAYRALLAEHGIDPAGVRTAEDFARLPLLTRENYANVYPENVAGALEGDAVNPWVTGKFVLFVDASREPRLRVVVETAPGAVPPSGATTLLAGALRADLRRLNSEFANYVPASHQTPVVELRPPGDPEYFPAGVKHRYTRP